MRNERRVENTMTYLALTLKSSRRRYFESVIITDLPAPLPAFPLSNHRQFMAVDLLLFLLKLDASEQSASQGRASNMSTAKVDVDGMIDEGREKTERFCREGDGLRFVGQLGPDGVRPR